MPSGPVPAAAGGGNALPPSVQRGNKYRRKTRGTLSALEVMQLWVDVGGPRDQAAMASVVSKHESSRRVHARGPVVPATGQRAVGAMQIHPDGATNAWDNMKQAVDKYNASGWAPWSVCNGGSAVGDHDAWAGGSKDCANLAKEAARLERRLGKRVDTPDGSVFDQLGDAVDKVNPIDDVAGAIAGVFEPVADFFKILTQADTWIRVGKVVLGTLILLVVAIELFGGGSRLARRVNRG